MLSGEERAGLLASVRRSAWRLESARIYLADLPYMAGWLAGETDPMVGYEDFAWLSQMEEMTGRGVSFVRVRLHDDPPTPYQVFSRWTGARNLRAGEQIGYLDRTRAVELGVPAWADFWLLDGERLVVYSGAETPNMTAELIEDPERVAEALAWWDTAVGAARFDVAVS